MSDTLDELPEPDTAILIAVVDKDKVSRAMPWAARAEAGTVRIVRGEWVKAFAADEKAARSLALALANTGNAFATIGVENFIADLQRATGVLDDNLRPAFRTLLTATGDVKKSQDALALALDISAGTGRDLGQVSVALARGFTGQTTGLSRLGAGLSKATLKTGDMNVIVGELTDKFKGQALAAAQGYSGQMDRLTVASNNAKEIIGKDLLDAMSLVAGQEGIGGAASAMENFAKQIGDAIYGIGVLTAKIKALPGAGFIGDILAAGVQFSGLGLLSKYGRSQKATPAQSPGERKKIDQINKDAIKFQKQQNDLKKIDNANTARKIALTGDELALKELEKKFDVERIGLYTALNQTTDSETKMRLLSLVAIHDQNTAMAGLIKKSSEAENAFQVLIEALRSTVRSILDKIAPELKQIQTLTTTGPNTPIETQRAIVREKLDRVMPFISTLPSRLAEINNVSGGSGATNITINATGIGDQQIAAVVQNAIQDLNRYGNSTTYAGAI